MSETSDRSPADDGPGISDDQLPEDLQPTDDNPLAKNPDQGSGAGEAGVQPGQGASLPPQPGA